MAVRLGSRVRGLRKGRGLTQVELARRLEISPSYLNLIEHDQRTLTAPLLLRIAEQFDVDLRDFTEQADAQLRADLLEILADPLFEPAVVDSAELGELVARAPTLARTFETLYRAYREARETADGLASQIYDDQQRPGVERSPMVSEEVSDFLQHRDNHVPQLEEAAERLWKDASLRRHALTSGLVRHLERAHDVEVGLEEGARLDGALRRFDPGRKRLALSERLPGPSRVFQLAVQIALLEHAAMLDRLVETVELTTDASRALGRVVLANYFAGAVVMPYVDMLTAAGQDRYDIELLCNRFGASFEQCCHRLTSLRRPGAEGVPFHMIRVDVAGNISKRFSASGIRFARFAGACPRWNVFSAFSTPGMMRTQVSVMPDGEPYFCVARTVPKGRGGHSTPDAMAAIGLGCRIEHARALVYSDGMDLGRLEGAIPIGVTCRLCPRRDCAQRAFPSLQEPLVVDANVRGPSFYTPV